MMRSSKQEIVKAWVTKYVFTQGVIFDNVYPYEHRPDCASYRASHCSPNEWSRTEEGAREQVRRKVEAALKSLEKRRKKLEVLLAQVERGELPMAVEEKVK